VSRGATLLAIAAASVVVLSGCSSASPDSHVAASRDRAAGRYAAAVSQPVADPDYPREGTTSLDALHYGLDLTWHGASRQLTGRAAIYFRATRDESAVTLDLGAPLQVDSVVLDGVVVASRHVGHQLQVATGPIARDSRHTLDVRYHGTPKPVPAPTTRSDIPDVGWTVTRTGQVWTMQEPYGAFTWYPVNDQPSDKAFYDITAHTTSAWRTVSNGHLVSDTVAAGERSMHWQLASPAASYLVTIAIGPYQRFTDTGPHGLPISYWVRPVDRSLVRPLRRTPRMLAWLEAKLGRYPFSSLGVVLVPSMSGMETQTMVTLGAGDLRDGGGLSDLVHEYAHQWYGDEVTPRTWPDVWLNESFAMYVQIRWESSHGYSSMRIWRHRLNADDQRLRTRYGPPGDFAKRSFAELDVYYCGARMLDRLHAMIGDRMFERVLKGWPVKHAVGNVDRDEWIRYLDRTTGRDLRSFVTKWLDSTTSPD
jgi:aminopeptidase N